MRGLFLVRCLLYGLACRGVEGDRRVVGIDERVDRGLRTLALIDLLGERVLERALHVDAIGHENRVLVIGVDAFDRGKARAAAGDVFGAHLLDIDDGVHERRVGERDDAIVVEHAEQRLLVVGVSCDERLIELDRLARVLRDTRHGLGADDVTVLVHEVDLGLVGACVRLLVGIGNRIVLDARDRLPLTVALENASSAVEIDLLLRHERALLGADGAQAHELRGARAFKLRVDAVDLAGEQRRLLRLVVGVGGDGVAHERCSAPIVDIDADGAHEPAVGLLIGVVGAHLEGQALGNRIAVCGEHVHVDRRAVFSRDGEHGIAIVRSLRQLAIGPRHRRRLIGKCDCGETEHHGKREQGAKNAEPESAYRSDHMHHIPSIRTPQLPCGKT